MHCILVHHGIAVESMIQPGCYARSSVRLSRSRHGKNRRSERSLSSWLDCSVHSRWMRWWCASGMNLSFLFSWNGKERMPCQHSKRFVLGTLRAKIDKEVA